MALVLIGLIAWIILSDAHDQSTGCARCRALARRPDCYSAFGLVLNPAINGDDNEQVHKCPHERGANYPGYINFTREDDGSVSVHLRGDPERRMASTSAAMPIRRGIRAAARRDEHCNNYCNMAPEKGPMQDSAE